jgi:hypothetical protein
MLRGFFSLAEALLTFSAKLSMTHSQFQRSNLSSAGLTYDKTVIGAIIFKDSKLLLLELAAHKTCFRMCWSSPAATVPPSTQLWHMHLHERFRRDVSEGYELGGKAFASV